MASGEARLDVTLQQCQAHDATCPESARGDDTDEIMRKSLDAVSPVQRLGLLFKMKRRGYPKDRNEGSLFRELHTKGSLRFLVERLGLFVMSFVGIQLYD